MHKLSSISCVLCVVEKKYPTLINATRLVLVGCVKSVCSIIEILEKVKKPPPLIRPSVSKGAAPPEAINIMRQCWAEQPDMRPDFNAVHDLFKTLNHGR